MPLCRLTCPRLPDCRRLDESSMLRSHPSGLSSESAGSQLPVIPSQDETHEEPPSTVEPKSDRQDSVSSEATANDSRAASFEEATGLRKVAVSVHDERAQLVPSCSLKSCGSDPTETCSRKQDPANGTETIHGGTVTKSTSGDTQASLGVSSMSGAEPNVAAVLGASTSSLTSIASSATYRQPPARHRRFAAGCIDENDLSTPYNHYRCLSPNEHRGTCARKLLRQRRLPTSGIFERGDRRVRCRV